MNTEKTVEDIVDEFISMWMMNGDTRYINRAKTWLTQTLQAERTKRDEMVEKLEKIHTREMQPGENRAKYLAFKRGELHMKGKIQTIIKLSK